MEGRGAQAPHQRVSKKGRTGPAIFVERSKKLIAQKMSKTNLQKPKAADGTVTRAEKADLTTGDGLGGLESGRKLKKPGTQRAKSPRPDAPARAPLPASAYQQRTGDMDQNNMDQIAADMNAWVLSEIGANLQEMEAEKKKEQARKFKPKVPAQRYAQRHPESAERTPAEEEETKDTPMMDASEDDDDDEEWVIEEYIRIPAKSMGPDVAPGEVGVLVLDGEEDNTFFFGPEEEDEDYDEDEDDENAENHYTADYPEEEVDSDDEYNRYAYLYRTGNASDNEEYDNANYSDHSDDEDKIIMEGDAEFDHDVAMARIKAYNLQRKRAMGMDVDG